MFYATHDYNCGKIAMGAAIAAFATQTEAQRYLLSAFDKSDFDPAAAEFGPGIFGDCWVKSSVAPHPEGDKLYAATFDCGPFTVDQMTVQGPGEHPGGLTWWLTPTPPVLIITNIKELAKLDA